MSHDSDNSRASLVAFLATLVTGVVIILGTGVPPQDVAATAATLFGAYSLWQAGKGRGTGRGRGR
ncbi:hypothetical protein AB0H29_11135 [Streptomyces thermolilacinus]